MALVLSLPCGRFCQFSMRRHSVLPIFKVKIDIRIIFNYSFQPCNHKLVDWIRGHMKVLIGIAFGLMFVEVS